MERPSYFQVALSAGAEGLLLGGYSGAVSALGGGLAGVLVENQTGSTLAGLAAGVAVGAALGAARAALLGSGAMVPATVVGGLLGAVQTLGGNAQASVRDSTDMGSVLAGALLPGPTKAVGGLAAASANWLFPDDPTLRSVAAGGLGLGLGAALAGLTGGSWATAALVGGLSAGTASFVGPRFGQMVRNFSQEGGTYLESRLLEGGHLKESVGPVGRSLLGAVPVGLAVEMGKAAVYSGGSPVGIVVGGVTQTLQLVEVLRSSTDTHTGSESEDVLTTTT